MGDMTSFNVDNGYFEALVRGFRAGILKRTDYHNLVECETIDGKNRYAIPDKHRMRTTEAS